MRKIVLAGGGTLGSVSPLLAVVQSMDDAHVVFIGTKNGPERTFLEGTDYIYKHIPSTKLRRYISLQTIADIIKFPFAVIKSLFILRNVKPDIILTSGGFVAVPVAIAAKLMSIPVIIHQQDIITGLANKLMSRLATKITVTFDFQLKDFPADKTVVTGNPVRLVKPSILKNKRKRILILGGSQGAKGMNQSLNKIIPRLTRDFDVVHVLGEKNYAQRLSLPSGYTARRFIKDDFAEQLEAADLIITRAGMSTMTEIAHFSKAAIIIPIEHSHQEANAQYFSKANGAIVLTQDDTESILKNARDLCSDDRRRKMMGNALHDLFPNNAVSKYIHLIDSLVRDKSKSVFLIGIGGSGMSALSRYFLSNGFSVYGSDLTQNSMSEALKSEGVQVYIGHNAKNLPKRLDQLVYSDAIPATNEELEAARKRGVPVYTLHEYLGRITAHFETLAITGTHGKTTTTSIAALAGIHAKLDPTVIIGSPLKQLKNSNFRRGSSNLLIVEADEWRGHMLKLSPKDVIITNVDADHLDYYSDIDQIQKAFNTCIANQPDDGLTFINSDDQYSSQLEGKHVVTFGTSTDADYRITDISIKDSKLVATILEHGKKLLTLTLSVPGKFNIYNATAVVAYFRKRHAIEPKLIAEGIASYTGVSRRFERIGILNESPVYSDYGHHPTAIHETLSGVKLSFPDKKLVVAFQPHSYARTKALFTEFTQAFSSADHVILTEVYDVAGRDSDKTVSSHDLFEKLTAQSKEYAKTLDDTFAALKKNAKADTIIIIMGAGNIDDLRNRL